MNQYHHVFAAKCPNNGAMIIYDLLISTVQVIMVEDIVAACAIDSAFHESIADDLAARFGGLQTLRANHHGVEIKTTRCGAE